MWQATQARKISAPCPCCHCFDRHMTAGNHFRIKRQHLGIAVARVRSVGRTHGEAVNIRAVERWSINWSNYILPEHAAARIGKFHALHRERLEIEMLFEARTCFLRRYDFKELFLTSRSAHTRYQIAVTIGSRLASLAHGE